MRGRTQRQDFVQGLEMIAGMKTIQLLWLARDRTGFKNIVTKVRL